MIKIKNKFMAAFLVSALTISSVSVVIQKDANIVYAAESKALRDAKAKISHLTKSIKTNYLGIKNQAMWQTYIKQARELIEKIPNSEKSQRNALTVEVNEDEALVNALARINHVEKSMQPKSEGGYGNALIPKNVPTWREYIRLANIDLEKVNKNIFKDQYDELMSRRDEVNAKLDAIMNGIFDSKFNYFIYSNSIDIDGDGNKDLVQIWGHKYKGDEEYDYYQEIKVSVKTSNNTYSIVEKEVYAYIPESYWGTESDICVADFNGDNKKEIIVVGKEQVADKVLYVFELNQYKLKCNKIDYETNESMFGLDIKFMDNYKLKATSSILGKEEIISFESSKDIYENEGIYKDGKLVEDSSIFLYPKYTFKDVDNDGKHEIIQSFYTLGYYDLPERRGVYVNNYIKYEDGKFKLIDMKVIK